MAGPILKRCTSCHEYTLGEVCPRCGAKANANRPAKFSPEDHYGEYRRKLKVMDRSQAVPQGSQKTAARSPPAVPPADSAPSGTSGANAPVKKGS